MPRLIEIVLFLAPFLGFVAWRLFFPSPVPPLWLTCGFGACVLLLLIVLAWVWHLDAGDTNQPYIPAELRDGRVVSGKAATPP